LLVYILLCIILCGFSLGVLAAGARGTHGL
jgi:hypothetical protein